LPPFSPLDSPIKSLAGAQQSLSNNSHSIIEPFIMVIAGETTPQDTQSFIARFLEIHDTQARSARCELDRLRELIDDASERLMSSFGVIGEIAARQNPSAADDQTQEIAAAVGDAVSALRIS
jgi:hypothetical protein